MQFHLNGFRPGDPHISEPDVRHQAAGTADGLPTQVDVLIVGCTPTGQPLLRSSLLSLISRPALSSRNPAASWSARPTASPAAQWKCSRLWLRRSCHEGVLLGQRVCLLEIRREPSRGLVRSNRIQDVEADRLLRRSLWVAAPLPGTESSNRVCSASQSSRRSRGLGTQARSQKIHLLFTRQAVP